MLNSIKDDLIFYEDEKVICENLNAVLKCGLYKYSDKRIMTKYIGNIKENIDFKLEYFEI